MGIAADAVQRRRGARSGQCFRPIGGGRDLLHHPLSERILTIGIGGFLALAALIIGLFAWLKADISSLRREMQHEIAGLRRETQQAIAELRERLEKRLDGLDGRLRAVEHGQAKLEGLLEGLREAISGLVRCARSSSTVTGETRNSRVNGLLSGMPGTVC